MNEQIKNFALSYIKKGFSIIPLKEDKKPLLPSWKKYQEVRATESELLEWLEKYPNMQIGIITGKISNLVVVDLDRYKEGFKFDIKLPPTRMAETGSGGLHYYFDYPDCDISNYANHEDYWDVRGEGGYIVAPPSKNEIGEYKFLNKLDTAELPDEILKKVKVREKVDTKPIVQKNYGGTIFDQLSNFDCRTGLEMLSGTSAVDGEIYTFRNRSGGGFLIDINGKDANCWLTPDGMIASGTRGAGGNTASPTLVQWLGWFGHSPQKKAEIIKEIFKFTDKPIVFEKSASVDSYTWGLDCIDREITTVKKGTVSILGASENAGKSTFCFFLARQNAIKYGHKVVLCSLESTEDELHQMVAFHYANISRIEERDNSYLENPKYIEKIKELQNQEYLKIIGTSAAESTTVESIEKKVAENGEVDLLIIDNLSCLTLGVKEYSENEATKNIIQSLIKLSRRINAPIILVHHYRKLAGKSTDELFRGTDDLAGSGAIKNLVHKVILVARHRGSDVSPVERAEFHIKEGKIRTRAGGNEFMIYYQNGAFTENYVNDRTEWDLI